MKFALECTNCIINQVKQVSDMKKLGEEKFILLRKVLSSLEEQDYNKTSPEIYGNVYKQIVEYFNNEDIYKDIREEYNEKFMNLSIEIEKAIDNSDNPLKMALATAIEGNLLDLAILNTFSIDDLISSILTIEQTKFKIDDSVLLLDEISRCNSILYIGDNCGEIVFDKLFIKTIKKNYPYVNIYFAVRGESAVNDVLLSDALQVNMASVANIVENGDSSLGTVINRCSKELVDLYNSVDLIIAKGQGNYESLSETPRDNLYYLLLTKCPLIAKEFNVPTMSVVCAKAKL